MRAHPLVPIALATLLVAVPAASGHGVGSSQTAAQHQAEDAVQHTPQQERRLARHTSAATAIDASEALAAAEGPAHELGAWGPVQDWPVVGVHVTLLPDGRVLAYDSVGDTATENYPVHDHTRATVWDPATGIHTPVNVDTGFNVFCSGLAHLMDGSPFLAGGNKNAQLNGIAQTHIFNPVLNTWRLGPTMAAERWYPTVTAMPDGEMLIVEGGSGAADTPEVYTTAGGLRKLSTATLSLPLYPWLDVAPNGRAFYSGPSTTMRSLSTDGSGAWASHGTRDGIDRGYGSRALFDVGRILVTGGGASSKDARVIDINGATPTVTATAPMANGRRQHNVTVLADGSVLATGGNSSGAGLVDLANGVYTAELWSPQTGQWRSLAAQQVTRQYHSTAILLPDARVLSSGGGICGTCDQVGYLAKNAELFTPPYLFKTDGSGELAPRPAVTDAPSTVGLGGKLTLTTPDAAAVRKVALVRLGANTHSVDMEQRYVPLAFTAGSGVIDATVPANPNVLPLGVYMAFVVDASGVPSVARMVRVTPPVAPPTGEPPVVALTSPADGSSFTRRSDVNLAATATDADGIAKVEFFSGSSRLATDTTAPYAYRWRPSKAGTYSLTARATDGTGATATSAAARVTIRR
jgi:hypothetical protein